MRYWILRTEAPSIEISPRSKVVTILSRRKARFEEGDQALLLEWGQGVPRFTHQGRVCNVQYNTRENAETLQETSVLVEEWVQLSSPSSLEDLKYSLMLIKNLERPKIHFRRGYRSVTPEDFETVCSGEHFVARSTYFYLLHALPTEMRLRFESLLNERRTTSTQNGPFRERVRILRAFIEERILSVGHLLAQISDLTGRLNIRVIGKEIWHVFADEPPLESSLNVTESIEEQVHAFRVLFRSLKNEIPASSDRILADALREIDEAIDSPNRLPRERRFERIFRDT